MNFISLYYFSVVVEEMNITRASERLSISQQALSKAIIRLENELGAKLFERKPEFSLTYSGNRFYEATKQILFTKESVLDELEEIRLEKKGMLRIGITASRSEMLLPLVMPEFTKKHSETRIKFIQGYRKYIADSLRNDEIDILIDFMPILVDNIVTIPLLSEQFLLVVPKSLIHNKFGIQYQNVINSMHSHVDLALFEDFPYVLMSNRNRSRVIFEQYALKSGTEIHLISEMDSNTALLYLACKGVGVTIYPVSFTGMHKEIFNNPDSPVEAFPIRDRSTFGDLVIAYKKTKRINTALYDFIEIAVEKTRTFRENKPPFY